MYDFSNPDVASTIRVSQLATERRTELVSASTNLFFPLNYCYFKHPLTRTRPRSTHGNCRPKTNDQVGNFQFHCRKDDPQTKRRRGGLRRNAKLDRTRSETRSGYCQPCRADEDQSGEEAGGTGAQRH